MLLYMVESLTNYRIQTVLDTAVDSYVKHKITSPGEELEFKFPNDFPIELLNQIQDLYLKKLSIVKPIINFRQNLSEIVPSYPLSASDFDVLDVRSNQHINGGEIIKYIQKNFCLYFGRESGYLFQGSAIESCPNNSEFSLAKKIIEQRMVLVEGGYGNQNSAMHKVGIEYLKLGGSVIHVITKGQSDLNNSSTRPLPSDNDRVMVLEVQDFRQGMAVFSSLCNQAYFGIGGLGTLAEMNYMIGKGLKLEFSDLKHWRNAIGYYNQK